jgi:Zn-dependent protease
MQARELILFLPVLLFSVVLHEFAHGWVAYREGDDTAYMLGRLTLNPLPHIDLFGSIILPLVLVLTRAGIILGWAKPVPVNPRKYRNYRRGDILVSLAGIAVNLMLAVGATLAMILLIHLQRLMPGLAPSLSVLTTMAEYGVLINLVLAFFNLIPIPPLDGSHVFYHLLPPKLGMAYRQLSRYGMMVLMVLLLLAGPVFDVLLSPAIMLYRVAMALVQAWT